MSGIVRLASEYGSLVAPEALEVGAKVFANSEQNKRKSNIQRIKKPRLPKNPALYQENTMSKANPTPAEVQASLDETLAKYVEGLKTPEAKASALIKIGMYQADLGKYAPMLQATDDEEFTQAVLGAWIEEGDGELKKMVLNCEVGSEEIPLAKAAPDDEEGELALAKMVDAVTDEVQRVAMLQKVGVYTSELRKLQDRIHEAPEEDQIKLIAEWIQQGDGTHFELKKAVAAAEWARHQASASVGERQAVDQVMGNASTAAGADLGDSSDSPDQGIRRTIPARSSAEGAGHHERGNLEPPGQDDSESLDISSGPNDNNAGGEVRPRSKIRRKGTTGGLGSVKGAESGAGGAVNSAAMNDAQKMAKYYEDLGIEMLKIMPEEARDEIEELEEDDQVEVVDAIAQHSADLMAWSDQTKGQLQKRALESSVTDWLSEDADSIVLKKWVAEALATAEEIPLDLAVEIMAWAPEGERPLNKQEVEEYLELQKISLAGLATAGRALVGGAKALGGRTVAAAGRAAGRVAGTKVGQAASDLGVQARGAGMRAAGRFASAARPYAAALKTPGGRAALASRAGAAVARNPLKTAAFAGGAGFMAGRASKPGRPAWLKDNA